MYVWNVTTETTWNYIYGNDNDDYDVTTKSWAVAAEDFQIAWNKVKKLALSKSEWFKDEEDEGLGKGFINKPVSVELISIERGDWLDG